MCCLNDGDDKDDDEDNENGSEEVFFSKWERFLFLFWKVQIL